MLWIGITNDAVESLQPFDSNLAFIIQSFIERQVSPVCLVAHNGYKFDFPILRDELRKVNTILSDFLLCMDSLKMQINFDENSGALLFNLPAVYKRVCLRSLENQHNAETDCLAMLEICRCQKELVYQYANSKAIQFSNPSIQLQQSPIKNSANTASPRRYSELLKSERLLEAANTSVSHKDSALSELTSLTSLQTKQHTCIKQLHPNMQETVSFEKRTTDKLCTYSHDQHGTTDMLCTYPSDQYVTANKLSSCSDQQVTTDMLSSYPHNQPVATNMLPTNSHDQLVTVETLPTNSHDQLVTAETLPTNPHDQLVTTDAFYLNKQSSLLTECIKSNTGSNDFSPLNTRQQNSTHSIDTKQRNSEHLVSTNSHGRRQLDFTMSLDALQSGSHLHDIVQLGSWPSHEIESLSDSELCASDKRVEDELLG